MDSPEEGISVRPMRLKVLYTFDQEHKNNCLARGTNILQIQTASVDATTQIGLVDLKTCVQTIVSASPELVAKLEHDFTIYAYDYSEPDTPLVGQGMLSWALASPSTMSNGQDDDDGASAMVTGRVTRNVLGLFSRNAQETLEVKVRLVPVPKSTQGDYLEILHRYNELSGMIGQGFDAQQWTNFVQAHPGLLSGSTVATRNETSASPADRTGLEAMQRMLTEGASPRETPDMSSSDLSLPSIRGPGSRPVSRSGTPANAPNFNQPFQRTASQVSRPSSRTSVRGSGSQQPPPMTHQRRDSFNSGYYSAEETLDEGPAKKRAKIVQADWSAKPNLNIERQPDSLRVAASTAASVRLHRPIAVNPALQLQQGSTEEPVRPPTPIARQPRVPLARTRTASGLRTGSFVTESSPPSTQYQHNFPAFPETTSPEDSRAQSIGSTPINIPSSPPMLQPRTSVPSSPVLPPMPREHDSGFMSGNVSGDTGGDFDMDTYFTDHPFLNFEDDFPEMEMPDLNIGMSNHHLDVETMIAHASNSTLVDKIRSPPVPPSASIPPQPLRNDQGNQNRSKSRAPISRPASRMAMQSPKLAPAPFPRARQVEQENVQHFQRPQRERSSLPQIPASEPVGPSLHRSRTWAGEVMSDIPQSDMAEPTTINVGRKSRPKRFGKEQTANRLKAAITGGEMPPFCDNCGAIETPAWRKAWAKVFESGYNEFETGLGDGAFLCTEVVDEDEQGNVTKFKAFKISKSQGDRDLDFVSVNLCNPCGLWLHKQKCMRPEARWNSRSKDQKEKRKRPSRPRSQRKAAQKKPEDDSGKSDAPASSPEGSEGVAPSEQDANDENYIDDARRKREEDDGEPELPPMPQNYRANSAEPVIKPWLGPHKGDAIVRRVQSSPIRHAAIAGQDLTPKPLRRMLFSPENTKTMALAEISGNVVRRSPRLNKTTDVLGVMKTPRGSNGSLVTNQTHDDGLDDLFNNDDNDNDLPHAQTPTPTRRSDRVIFKTPNKPTPAPKALQKTPTVLSPAAKRLLQALKTPRTLGGHPIATALLGEHQAGQEMTPFTLQIHQILSDTANLSSPLRSSASKTRPLGNSRPENSNSNSNDIFDFPDLPPLNSTSSLNSATSHPIVDFSEFTHMHSDQVTTSSNAGVAELMMLDDLELQELLSTDIVMPSSPPRANETGAETSAFMGWFESEHGGGLWEDMGGNAGTAGQPQQSGGFDGNADENGHGNGAVNELESGRRVSPRKNKGKKFDSF